VTKEAANPPEPSVKPGDVVARRYEIDRELGRGGMGVVYLCQDLVTQDWVALKCVFGTKGKSHEAIWFQQEARALAALDHPVIVGARDFGMLPDGSPYLVMDALRGRSIHVWKYLCKIPWAVTWTVVDQVLSGLAHAHARGVIHGDLKPSNIMIDPRGGTEEPRAYILDLGLAWLLEDHIDPRLATGKVVAPTLPFGLGTPGWMAPEQIKRAAPHIGPPTDLYALGSILFELLTGREVFQGSSTEILRMHRDTPVTEVPLNPEVPKGVADFVKRLLAKRPWHRFRFAADAQAEWARFRPAGPIRWMAPRVRVGDEKEDPTQLPVRPPGDPGRTALALAPGILALRPSPLVGRAEERARLWEQVQQVVNGEGPKQRLVLLRGPAGVGKSRLVEWLCQAVHEQGVMLPLRSRYRRVPGPADGLRGALIDHLNMRQQPRDVIEQAFLNEWEVGDSDDQGRTWVAAVATWLRPRTPDEPDKPGPSRKRFLMDKPELRWVIIRYLLERITSDGRPLCLWLDDLHWASASACAGLVQLCREAPQLRLLMVATVRDEALAGHPAGAANLEMLARNLPTTRIELTPLTEEEMREMLRSSINLSPEAEDVVLSRSEGNPLFALQLVHAWASSGRLQLVRGRYEVPNDALQAHARTTAELWEQRMLAIDEPLRPAALAAAALGEVLHLAPLTRLLSLLGMDAAQAIRAMQQAELLVVDRNTRLRWPHALLQEHLFTRLNGSPDATRVFRYAADALALHPEHQSHRIIQLRANNLIRAGFDEEAAELILDFVERSWSRVRDVYGVSKDLDVLEGRPLGPHEAPFLRWKGETERLLGSLDAAREHAELARQKATSERLQAHCLRLLAHIASDQGVPALGRIEAVLALTKFDLLEDRVGRASCELLLGEIDYLLGNHPQSREWLASASVVFREQNDQLRLSQALILLALVEQSAGRLSSARELLEQARAELDAIGYQLGLAQVAVTLGHVELRAGNLDQAHRIASETLVRFRELVNPRGEAASERLAAMVALGRGDLSAAFRHALSTFSLYDTRIADPWGRVEGSLLLAQVALAENSLQRAQEHLAEAEATQVDEAEPVQHRHLTAAWLALVSGHTEQAHDHILQARRAFPDARRTGDNTPLLLQRLAPLVQGTPAETLLTEWTQLLGADRTTTTPLPLP
jgi:tetratricopeptide (TPR) repeat protein